MTAGEKALLTLTKTPHRISQMSSVFCRTYEEAKQCVKLLARRYQEACDDVEDHWLSTDDKLKQNLEGIRFSSKSEMDAARSLLLLNWNTVTEELEQLSRVKLMSELDRSKILEWLREGFHGPTADSQVKEFNRIKLGHIFDLSQSALQRAA